VDNAAVLRKDELLLMCMVVHGSNMVVHGAKVDKILVLWRSERKKVKAEDGERGEGAGAGKGAGAGEGEGV
jgi:hypothetical protein